MATIGLRDLYRAPITIGDGGVEEYGTPVKMAKAISAELSVEVAEAICIHFAHSLLTSYFLYTVIDGFVSRIYPHFDIFTYIS